MGDKAVPNGVPATPKETDAGTERSVAEVEGEEQLEQQEEEQQQQEEPEEPESTSMALKVHCRDITMMIKVGAGNQHFLWLGSLVARRYAEMHKQFQKEQFVCVHIEDAEMQVLFPSNKIRDCCESGDAVFVDLLGPKIGINDPSYKREKTLWELQAYTPREEWVDVVIHADLKEWFPDLPVAYAVKPGEVDTHALGLIGNFNNWRVPISMKEKPAKKQTPDEPGSDDEEESSLAAAARRAALLNPPRETQFSFTCAFPPGAPLAFRFVPVKTGQATISHHYKIAQDQSMQKLNFIRVEAPFPDFSHLQPPPIIDYYVEEEVTEVTKVDQHLLGEFQGVITFTPEMLKKSFEKAFEDIQIFDIVREVTSKNEIKAVLFKHYNSLRKIFRSFSKHAVASGEGLFMNLLSYYKFCNFCNLREKNPNGCTITKLDNIFRRVNIEEIHNRNAYFDSGGSSKNIMILQSDPMNPDNALTIGEFMESLIRISFAKFKGQTPAGLLKKLLRENIIPAVGHLASQSDELRDNLNDSKCQAIFKLFRKRLFAMYNKYADSITRNTATPTICLKEYNLWVNEVNKNLQDGSVEPSRVLAQQAWNLAQSDEITAQGHDAGLNEMTYAEWLEVIARFAVVQYPKEETLDAALARWMNRVFKESTNEKLMRRRSMLALERQASMALPGGYQQQGAM